MKDPVSEAVLYNGRVDPVRTDGRDIDKALAELSGEASHQVIEPDRVKPVSSEAHAVMFRPSAQDPTYYDLPVLKKSVWSIDIPLYYFVGGAGGAALTLGAAVQLRKDRGLRELSEHIHWMGIVGSSLGAAFLIHDLGRPSRFLNMMRVFRPTSPMNMGAWILGGAAPTAIATGLFINRGGWIGAVGEVTGYMSGVFGAALAGYTGVLVANSAIPVWQAARHWMPILFMASSISGAAAILDLLSNRPSAGRITFVFGTVGRVAELAAAQCVEKSAAKTLQVAAPFRKGATALLWKASSMLTAASLVLTVLPGRSAKRRKIGGLLGALGSLALRFAVHYISNASSEDARASFHQQRQRMSDQVPAGQA
jgi:formate-dependent nitrite reductase membrane component NrfD